jgi:hypothetical protein
VDHDEAGGAPCPVCGGADIADTVRRERLPVMQNYVYPTREAALTAPYGRLLIAVCRDCGFAWSNYFTPESFGELLRRAGFAPLRTRAVIGSQYLATDASCGEEAESERSSGREIADSVEAYATNEAERIDSTANRLQRDKEAG